MLFRSEAFYSWVLGTLDGLVIVAGCGLVGSLQLSCGDCPNLCVKVSVATLEGHRLVEREVTFTGALTGE